MELPVFLKEKAGIRQRFEKSLCISLFIVLAGFVASKRESTGGHSGPPAKVIVVDAVDLPPLTKVSSENPPPIMPQVPIPVEDMLVSADATIDMTEIEVNVDFTVPEFGSDYDETAQYVAREPQKQVKVNERGVLKLALLVNQEGWVDSVIVVQNTTNDHDFELSSVKRAYRTRYRDQPNQWIERIFEYRKD
ncbi:hypothetical protein JXO52_08020 [bacterium]|nr:hypothetical protein [bacterium]